MVNKILTLVAVFMALALFLVPTTSFAADGPRRCDEASWEDTTYLCFRLKNEGKTFGFMAPHLAKRVGLSLDEFLALNGWDDEFLAQPIEPGVRYLYLVTQEAYVAYNSSQY